MGGVCTRHRTVLPHKFPSPHESLAKKEKPIYTRMIEAAASGDVEKLDALSRAGAEVNARDKTGRSALHLACAEGKSEAVRFLAGKGADLNVADRRGILPLEDAILQGHIQVVEELLRAGAKLSTDSHADMDLTLLKKSFRGDLLGVRCVIEGGVGPRATDHICSTALKIASEKGHFEIVEYLVLQGASLTQRSFKSDRSDSDRSISVDIKHPKLANFTVLEAFPRPIAAAVLNGRSAVSIERESASLFFADMCGFTAMCGALPASSVSDLLRRLYDKLDRLAHVHGVQQVHIAGDAYVAATNLTEDQPHDHAARLARFAHDALAAARATSLPSCDAPGAEPLPNVALRIGLHAGPVVAAVIASAGPRYTLLGETVAVAAAMERCGAEGRIQCSAAFARLVAAQAHDVILQPRCRSHRQAGRQG